MHFGTLPLSIALSLVSCSTLSAKAQDGSSGDSTFLQDYLTFLNSAGYTSLSSALQQVQQNGNVSSDWLNDLSSGNWTIFVPTNQAFEYLPPDISNNASALSSYLSYHNVYGNAVNTNNSSGDDDDDDGSSSTTLESSASSTSTSESSFGTAAAYILEFDETDCDVGVFPNDTIGRTLLTDPDYVQLEGNGSRAQVLAWARRSPGGDINILNQALNTTVANTTQWGNLLLAEINNVLIPPGNVLTALQAFNNTQLISLLNSIQVPSYGNSSSGGGANNGGNSSESQSASATSTSSVSSSGTSTEGNSEGGANITALQALENLRGFTLFAPAADAFTSDLNNTIQGLQSSNNQTALLTLLQNHYVNGSTFYGPTLRELAFNSSSGDSDANSTVVSAAGQYFSFSSNSSGLFVSNGNGAQAQITRPDVLVENGVIHIIDRVLVNEQSNPSAASSAYSSFSMEATQSATDTTVWGPLPIPTESTASFSLTESVSSTTESSSTSGETASVTTQAGFRFDRRL
ncbi:hypothetical protein H1R20_g76, partial [Candolleomyces eurysporus]